MIKLTSKWRSKARFKLRTRRRKILAATLAVLILITSLQTLLFFREAEAAWYDENWAYRYVVDISGPTSSQTDYQVGINIDTASLISGNKMQSDCDDLRVTDISGTILPFWVQTCDDTSSKIWAKVGTLPTSGISLYLYYGNPSAANGEDVTNTFVLWDDFNGASLDTDIWQVINSGTGSESVSGGQLSITSSGDWWGSSDTSRIILSKSSFSNDYAFESRIIDSGSANYNRFFGLRASTATNSRMVAMLLDNNQSHLSTVNRVTDGAGTTYQGEDIATFSEPYIAKWTRETSTLKAYTDSTFINTVSSISNLDYVALTSTNNGTSTFDWVFVRKFASPEPEATLGEEERGPGPAAYWKFDEGYGTQYHDATVNRNDLNFGPVTGIEQQINIIDQDFTIGDNETYDPKDNSLGIIRWDADKYDGATIYFEAIIKDSALGGSCSDGARAYLYDTAGSQISGATARPCTTSFGRDRSSTITLTDDTDYTVRLWNNTGTAVLRAARLIIVQSNTVGLDDTVTQIELGANESQTNSSATQLTDKKIYRYDSTQFEPSPTAYLEASLRSVQPTIEQQINIIDQDFTLYDVPSYNPADNSLGIIRWDANRYTGATVYFEAIIKDSALGGSCSDAARAYLYDTADNQISGATARPCTTSFGRARSSAITLTDDTDYTVRFWNNNGTAVLRAARLIIVQSSSTGIDDTTSQIEIGAAESQGSSTATQLTDKKIYQYDSAQFSPAPTAYFEASIRSVDPTIEQQINLLDQDFTNTTGSFLPSDNSLGLFHWDADKYSGETLYLNVVLKDSGLGGSCSDQARAALYTEGGTQVAASITYVCSTSYAHARSGSFTLTDDTNYTIRMWNNSGTAVLHSAWLSVVQSESGGIVDTRSHIEVGDDETGFTNESYAALTDEKIYLYDQDQFNPAPTASFSATLKIDDSGDTVHAQLFNCGNPCNPASGQQVAEITHTGDTNWTLVTADNIHSDGDWDTTNDDEYIVRIRCNDDNTGGCTGNIANAKIILDQNAGGGITDVELIHQQINSLFTDADTTYTDQDFKHSFNPDLEEVNSQQGTLLGGTFTYFYEGTLMTDNGSNAAFAQLKNDEDGLTISNSEITTSNTSYTRVRSGDITSDLPSYPGAKGDTWVAGKNLDTQLKNNSTSTTSAASTWLVIQASSLATSSITAYADLYNLSDTTQVASSEVSTTNTTWTRVRSGSITLTTLKNYVVRLKSEVNNAPIYMANAKLVLDQNDVSGITDVELIHEYVNAPATDSDSTYTDADYLNRYNPDFEADGDQTGTLLGGTFTYFFESTLKTDNGTNAAFAQLRNDSDASVISNSEVTTSSTSYTRVRSPDITSDMPQNQTVGKNLDTQLKNNSTSKTSVSTSWLVVQTSSLSTGTATAYADLYNLTDSTQVSGSEVSSTSNNWNRVRSSAITLTTAKDYVVRTKSSTNGVAIYIANAKLILEQSVANTKVSSVEVVHQYINHLATDSDTGYTDQDFMNEYNPDNFDAAGGGSFTYFFESTLKTSNASNAAYAQLENDTDTSAISSSEVSTNSTSYTRAISGDITGNMPGSTKTLETQLKNNSTDTTSATSSWLIIQAAGVVLANDQPSWRTEDQCVFGKCLFFDGSDDAAVGPRTGFLDLDGQLASGFTFQGWVRVNSDGEANQGEILDKGTNTYLRITNEGADGLADLEASLDLATDNATVSVVNGITLNKWHHIAMVYTDDGDDEISLYIDTVNQGTSTNGNGSPASDSNSFLLGGDSSNNFHGFIDEFKVYREERTEDEIKTDFIKGTSSLNGASAAQGIRPYYDLSDGLVGYWKMDEASADTCTGATNDSCDSSGNGIDGAWQADAASAAGKFGNAITLDGTGDYISLGNNAMGDLGDNHTVSAWVYDRSSDGRIITEWQSGVCGDFTMSINNTDRKLLVSNGGAISMSSANNSLTANKWNHVVFVSEAEDAHIYIDGTLDTSNGSDLNWQNGCTAQDVIIGANVGGSNDLDGLFDDFRIYNRAFSPSEVSFLYNWAPGPVGYWPLDENTGTTTVYDRSGNDNNGTMNGSMTEDDWVPGRFGSALDFDNTNDYVTMADSGVFDFGTGDFSLSGWFNHSSTLPPPATASVTTTTVTTSTDEGLGGGEASWSHRVVHDPNNNRWHIIYLDSGSDIHTQSTADTSGTTWTDGIDIKEGTIYDNEDYSCVAETDDNTTYLHCVYSTGSDDIINYKRCTLSGTTPFITCDSEQIVIDSTHASVTTADDFAYPSITVDSNDCVLIFSELEDDSIVPTSAQYLMWLFKEGAPCGDGTWSDATGFPKESIQSTTPGIRQHPMAGIESFGDLDAQLFWLDTDDPDSTDLETIFFDGDTDSLGTQRTLDDDVEFGDNSGIHWSVAFNTTSLTFGMDDITTDVDAYFITTKDGSTVNQVDTNLNTDGLTTLVALQTTTAVVDTVANGGDDIWAFAMDVADTSDIYYSTSTDGGASWSSSTLWIDSFDTNEAKFLSAGFNSENCDIMVTWVGNDVSPFDINTKVINTGSCDQDMLLARHNEAGYKIYMDENGYICFGIDDDTAWEADDSVCTSASYADSNWHHFEAVKNGTDDITLYIDGIQIGQDISLAATGAIDASSALYLGINTDGSGSAWDGIIDEVKMYSYARSPSQIIEDMNAGHPAPGSPIGSTAGYWKFDEGYSPTLNDSSPNTNPASIPAGATGGAIKIDDGSDFGGLNGEGQEVFRTTRGTLYAFLNDGGSCEIWKSSDEGATWGEENSGSNPACHTTDDVAGAIDANNTLHLIYRDNSSNIVQYITFDTTTDTFGTEETVTGLDWTIAGNDVDIAIDSNNIPHVVAGSTDIGGNNGVEYSNWVGGSWDTTPVEIENVTTGLRKVSMTINEDNIPELVYVFQLADILRAAVGNQNDASSFTKHDVDDEINDTTSERGATIAVDQDGNTWIAYVDDPAGSDGTENIALAKHSDGSAWTSGWTTSSKPATEEGIEPHIAIDQGYIYVFYEGKETGTADDIIYDRYDGSSWAGETTLETGTYQNAKAKWSFYNNNHGQAQIDYLFDDGTDVFYNTLSFGEPATWKAKDACKLDKCLEYDGTNDVSIVGNDTAIDLNGGLSSGFTFSAWVYADTDGEGSVGQIFQKGTNTYLRVDNESGSNLDVEGSLDLATSNATLNISTAITTASWNHIAMSWTDDGDDEITIWVNGVNRGSSTNGNGAAATDTNNIFIGGSSSANFDGRIDDFKVYSSELTAAQIKGDFTARSAASFGGVLGAQDNEGFGGNAPVGWWPMNDNTGTGTDAVTDISGNENHGDTNGSMTNDDWVPTTGGPRYANGLGGSALDFDGSNDYLDAGNDSSLDFGTGDFSISVWLKVNDNGVDQGFIVKADQTGGSGGTGYYLRYAAASNNATTFRINDGVSTEVIVSHTGVNVGDGSWHHVAVTADRSGLATLYMDGVERASASISGKSGSINVSNTQKIGSRTNGTGEFADGLIDEVKLFNYLLTPAQVAYDFNRGKPLGYWKLDDCTGTNADDSGSGDNDGTITIGGTGDNTSPGTCSGSSGEAWFAGATGKRNASLDFDGTDDYVSVAATDDLRITGDLTFGAWIKADTVADDENIIYMGQGSGETEADNELYIIRTDTDGGTDLDIEYKHEYGVGTNYSPTWQTNLSLGTWYHVMVVRDVTANTYKLYVDGKFFDSATTVNDPTGGSNSTLKIGAEFTPLALPFDGQIDDVRIYNYAMTDDQVKRVYNFGAQFFGPATGSP